MHNYVFEKSGLDITYAAYPCKEEHLPQAISALRIFPFVGVNVTLPYKEKVLPFLDELSPLSQAIGAVNTIAVREGKLLGTTTDATGFLKGLLNAQVHPNQMNIAVIGSGGTARTLAFALCIEHQPASLTFFARNETRMAELTEELALKTGFTATSHQLSNFPAHSSSFQLIIQATSVGMSPHTEESPLPASALYPHQILCDVIYNPQETLLLQQARAKGCQVIGGLPMLAYQGMASAEFWLQTSLPENLYFEALQQQL